jgi:regulator of protease activity HflC (stomatin/prohibitin superfamily)
MRRKRFYQRPGFRRFTILVVGVALYLWLSFLLEEPLPTLVVVGHLILAALVLLFAVALSSQFILPVRSSSERMAAFWRVLAYWIGIRGPVMVIHNGRVIEAPGERRRSGSGVLLIDQASAAVLRTKTRFTRAVGPGIAFTKPEEYLAEALDLRRQVRSVESVDPLSGSSLQQDDLASLARTEDGIPIAADLSVTFILDPGHSNPPREGSQPHLPPYEFNARAAEKAVFGHTVHQGVEVPWTEIPLRLVADLWREEAKNWCLEALFTVEQDQITPLEHIQDRILSRLVPPTPEDSPSMSSDAEDPNRESQILHSRGIRVLDVKVSDLRLPSDISEGHTERWREAWAGAVQGALTQASREADLARQLGEIEAQENLAREITAELRSQIAKSSIPNMQETLSMLLKDAGRVCTDQELIADGSALAMHLRQISDEVASLDADCQPRTG